MEARGIGLAIVASALLITPLATSAGVVPNPILNGSFELFIPPQAGNAIEAVPYMNECWGIGHQVLYGSETAPGKATGGEVLSPDPSNAHPEEIPQDALAHQSDEEAEKFGSTEEDGPVGYAQMHAKTCSFSEERGYDLVWLTPAPFAKDDAIHWSSLTAQFGDFDGDGDREAKVPAGARTHNMWQAYPSPFQAFTPNAEALEFDVEAGSVADGARILISLSATPLETQTDRVVFYLDCQLSFSSDELQPDANGHVSADPLDATFTARNEDCDEAKQAWDEATNEEDKRDVLGKLRIVQFSLWGFEGSPVDSACGCHIIVDNVSLTQATSVAEELARGNVNQNPDL